MAPVELQVGPGGMEMARRTSRAGLEGISELLSSTGPAEVVQDGSQEVLQKQVRRCHGVGEKQGADLQDLEEPHILALARSPLNVIDRAAGSLWGKVSIRTCWSSLVLSNVTCPQAPPCSAGGEQMGISILSCLQEHLWDVPALRGEVR